MKAEEYLQYFSDNDPMKKIYQGRLYKEQGDKENAYKTFEDIVLSAYHTLNFAFSLMTGLALEEGDIQEARYLADLYDGGEQGVHLHFVVVRYWRSMFTMSRSAHSSK